MSSFKLHVFFLFLFILYFLVVLNYFLGIIDEILQSLQFESDPENLPRLTGDDPIRQATHFVNPEDKVLRADSVKKGKDLFKVNIHLFRNMVLQLKKEKLIF